MSMDADDLHEEWTDGESGLPAWRVQQLRDDLRAHGVDVPRGRRQIGEWLESHKGAVTRKLAEAAGVSDPDSSDSEEDGDEDDG